MELSGCSEAVPLPFCEFCCSKLQQLALQQKRGLEIGAGASAVTARREGVNWSDHLAAEPQTCFLLSLNLSIYEDSLVVGLLM